MGGRIHGAAPPRANHQTGPTNPLTPVKAYFCTVLGHSREPGLQHYTGVGVEWSAYCGREKHEGGTRREDEWWGIHRGGKGEGENLKGKVREVRRRDSHEKDEGSMRMRLTGELWGKYEGGTDRWRMKGEEGNDREVQRMRKVWGRQVGQGGRRLERLRSSHQELETVVLAFESSRPEDLGSNGNNGVFQNLHYSLTKVVWLEDCSQKELKCSWQ